MTEIMIGAERVTAGEIVTDWKGTAADFTSGEHGALHLSFIEGDRISVNDGPRNGRESFTWAGRTVSLHYGFTRQPGGWVLEDKPYTSVSFNSKPLTPVMLDKVQLFVCLLVREYMSRPEVTRALLAVDVEWKRDRRDRAGKDEQEAYTAYVKANHERVALEVKLQQARARLAAHDGNK